MTTYGYSKADILGDTLDSTLACRRGVAMGVRTAVYDAGMEIPCVGLSTCCTPSRHSGDNSLSAKEPRSSETSMSTLPIEPSARTGPVQARMSDLTTVTLPSHVSWLRR